LTREPHLSPPGTESGEAPARTTNRRLTVLALLLGLFLAIQGIGAGAIQPVALTIVGDLFDVRQRARVQGLLAAIAFAGFAASLFFPALRVPPRGGSPS